MLMNKFMSRKFWISVAAFLASIATMVSTAGIICGVVSAAIYAASEAYVDGASVSANGTSKVITATTNSSSVVQAALQPQETAE